MGAGLGDSTPASHSPGKRQHKTETRILLGGGKEKIIGDGDLAFIANPKRGVGGRKCAPGCCPGAARGRIDQQGIKSKMKEEYYSSLFL